MIALKNWTLNAAAWKKFGGGLTGQLTTDSREIRLGKLMTPGYTLTGHHRP